MMLLDKKFKYDESVDNLQGLEMEKKNSVTLMNERKADLVNDPMARDLELSFMSGKGSFYKDDRSISMRKDEDIIANILTFVSTHIPSLKVDNFNAKERAR